MARNEMTRTAPTWPDFILLALALWSASYAEQYIFRVGGPPPAVWEAASLLIFTAIVTLRAFSGASIWRRRSQRFRNFSTILALYIVWLCFNYLYSSQSLVAETLFWQRIRVGAFIFLFAYTFDHPRLANAFFIGCLLLAIGGALLNVIDFQTALFSKVQGRAAGLYVNPTIAGFMLTTLGILGMQPLSPPIRYIAWSTVCAGVFLTFSRDAWIYIVLSTVWLGALGYFGFGRGRFIFALFVIACAAYLTAELLSGRLYADVAASPLAPYLNLNTIGRLGGTGDILGDFSASERWGVLNLGISRFLDSPIIGHGLAYTYEWEMPVSTHNMYVLFAAEGGLVGLSVYLAFVYAACAGARSIRLLLAALFILAGFFSHNLLDSVGEAVIIAALAIAPLNARARP